MTGRACLSAHALPDRPVDEPATTAGRPVDGPATRHRQASPCASLPALLLMIARFGEKTNEIELILQVEYEQQIRDNSLPRIPPD